MDKIRGRVRKFGNNIDTDNITPAALLHLPIEELKRHAFKPISPDFYGSVQEGDIIVAGDNYGCGSSREQATEVIKLLGIKFIVCQSMARIYFRNCVAIGLYPIIAEEISLMVDENDEIEIDMDKGVIKNINTDKTTFFKPITDPLKQIIEAGGILNRLKMKYT